MHDQPTEGQPENSAEFPQSTAFSMCESCGRRGHDVGASQYGDLLCSCCQEYAAGYEQGCRETRERLERAIRDWRHHRDETDIREMAA